MGFAPVASVAILMVAVFQILGGTVPSLIDANAALDDVRHDASERALQREESDATIDSTSSGASSTDVTATNTGNVPIRLWDVVLVLDGEPMAPGNWTVDGMSTDLWLPGESATLSVASGPHTQVALSLPAGTLVYGGS